MADTDTTSNPFSKEDQSVNMGIIVDMIENIVKTPPLKMGDTGKYHIYLKDRNNTKSIVLSAAQLLEGPGKFSTLFFDTFGDILYATKKEWPTFVKYVATQATPGKPEETAAVMAGHMMFEQIAHTMETTSDKKHLIKRGACNRLVEHIPHGEKWYVLPSAAVSDIINELPIKATHDDISQAMAACGLKKENTALVKVDGMPIRCWWFSVDKLREINSDMGVSK